MSPDPERFRRVETLFVAAAELPPAERTAFLRSECVGDPSLIDEVVAMLAHDSDTALGGPNEFRGSLQQVLDEVVDVEAQVGVPTRVGRYDVVRRIGLGGMGAVYEATQSHPQRRVALKVVRPDALSPEMLARFRHETELLGRLQHRGIAQIFEAGTFDLGDGAQPFFAMEYIDGQQLLEYAGDHALATKERLDLLARVCDAVQHAHQQGVIHRDLKSDNVLVDGDGQPKILDFGVGRVIDDELHSGTAWTAAGQIVGTLAYMSPEQVRGSGRDVDTRSDVYALGVLMYELLAGRPPFELGGLPIAEAARRICEDDPPRLRDQAGPSRGDVEAIVGKTLEKEKARRYASASDLASDIRRYLADQPIHARPATTWYQLRKFARRHRVAVVGGVATAVALTIGVISTAVQAVRATRHADVAERNEQAAQRMAYRANIAAASSALALGHAPAARRHLDEAPPELRQWEWHHLDRRLDATESVFRSPSESGAVVGGSSRLAFLADRTPLFASLEHGCLCVVDVASGRSVTRIIVDTAPIAVALSPDGTRIGAVDERLGLRIWDASTGRQVAQGQLTVEAPLVSLGFNRDGSVLQASSEREVQLIDGHTGSLQARHRIEASSQYLGSVFVADGRHLTVAVGREKAWGKTSAIVDQVLRTLDVRTGHPVLARSVPGCSGVLASSAGGSRLAAGTDDKIHITRILDGTSLVEIGQVGGHPQCARCAAFSADGRLLATGSHERIVIHDAVTREVRKTLFLPGMTPKALRWSPCGTRLLVADALGEVRLVRWDAPAFLELAGHTSFVYVAAWSPDGTLVASAGWDGTVRLWDASTGANLATLTVEDTVKGDTWCQYVGFSRDGTRVLAYPRTTYVAWDVATGLRDKTSALESVASRVAPQPSLTGGGAKMVQYSHGGQNYATSPDNTLLLRNNLLTAIDTGVDRLTLPARNIRAVAVSFDNSQIATGGLDGMVRIWDAVTGDRLQVLAGHTAAPHLQQGGGARIFSVEFGRDGSRLISGGDDARVVLWDLDSGKDVLTLQPHRSYVHVVAFSPDGTRILSGSGDTTLRIWDSVSLREREMEIRAAATLRAELRPRVERLLDELADRARVAVTLRSDATLDPARRRAALRVLLALSTAPR